MKFKRVRIVALLLVLIALSATAVTGTTLVGRAREFNAYGCLDGQSCLGIQITETKYKLDQFPFEAADVVIDFEGNPLSQSSFLERKSLIAKIRRDQNGSDQLLVTWDGPVYKLSCTGVPLDSTVKTGGAREDTDAEGPVDSRAKTKCSALGSTAMSCFLFEGGLLGTDGLVIGGTLRAVMEGEYRGGLKRKQWSYKSTQPSNGYPPQCGGGSIFQTIVPPFGVIPVNPAAVY